MDPNESGSPKWEVEAVAKADKFFGDLVVVVIVGLYIEDIG